MHFTADGAGTHICGSAVWHNRFNVTTMASKAVITVIAEISDVADSTAGGHNLDQRAIDAAKRYIAAEGVDLNVPVLNVGQRTDH